jgi:hypothetical protein
VQVEATRVPRGTCRNRTCRGKLASGWTQRRGGAFRTAARVRGRPCPGPGASWPGAVCSPRRPPGPAGYSRAPPALRSGGGPRRPGPAPARLRGSLALTRGLVPGRVRAPDRRSHGTCGPGCGGTQATCRPLKLVPGRVGQAAVCCPGGPGLLGTPEPRQPANLSRGRLSARGRLPGIHRLLEGPEDPGPTRTCPGASQPTRPRSGGGPRRPGPAPARLRGSLALTLGLVPGRVRPQIAVRTELAARGVVGTQETLPALELVRRGQVERSGDTPGEATADSSALEIPGTADSDLSRGELADRWTQRGGSAPDRLPNFRGRTCLATS